MKFNWFNRFFSKYDTTQDYEFVFRASFPLASGTYRETDSIRITIPAHNKEQAKRKLDKHLKERIKLTVISVSEGTQTMKSKTKKVNPQFN